MGVVPSRVDNSSFSGQPCCVQTPIHSEPQVSVAPTELFPHLRHTSSGVMGSVVRHGTQTNNSESDSGESIAYSELERMEDDEGSVQSEPDLKPPVRSGSGDLSSSSSSSSSSNSSASSSSSASASSRSPSLSSSSSSPSSISSSSTSSGNATMQRDAGVVRAQQSELDRITECTGVASGRDGSSAIPPQSTSKPSLSPNEVPCRSTERKDHESPVLAESTKNNKLSFHAAKDIGNHEPVDTSSFAIKSRNLGSSSAGFRNVDQNNRSVSSTTNPPKVASSAQGSKSSAQSKSSKVKNASLPKKLTAPSLSKPDAIGFDSSNSVTAPSYVDGSLSSPTGAFADQAKAELSHSERTARGNRFSSSNNDRYQGVHDEPKDNTVQEGQHEKLKGVGFPSSPKPSQVTGKKQSQRLKVRKMSPNSHSPLILNPASDNENVLVTLDPALVEASTGNSDPSVVHKSGKRQNERGEEIDSHRSRAEDFGTKSHGKDDSARRSFADDAASTDQDKKKNGLASPSRDAPAAGTSVKTPSRANHVRTDSTAPVGPATNLVVSKRKRGRPRKSISTTLGEPASNTHRSQAISPTSLPREARREGNMFAHENIPLAIQSSENSEDIAGVGATPEEHTVSDRLQQNQVVTLEQGLPVPMLKNENISEIPEKRCRKQPSRKRGRPAKVQRAATDKGNSTPIFSPSKPILRNLSKVVTEPDQDALSQGDGSSSPGLKLALATTNLEGKSASALTKRKRGRPPKCRERASPAVKPTEAPAASSRSLSEKLNVSGPQDSLPENLPGTLSEDTGTHSPNPAGASGMIFRGNESPGLLQTIVTANARPSRARGSTEKGKNSSDKMNVVAQHENDHKGIPMLSVGLHASTQQEAAVLLSDRALNDNDRKIAVAEKLDPICSRARSTTHARTRKYSTEDSINVLKIKKSSPIQDPATNVNETLVKSTMEIAVMPSIPESRLRVTENSSNGNQNLSHSTDEGIVKKTHQVSRETLGIKQGVAVGTEINSVPQKRAFCSDRTSSDSARGKRIRGECAGTRKHHLDAQNGVGIRDSDNANSNPLHAVLRMCIEAEAAEAFGAFRASFQRAQQEFNERMESAFETSRARAVAIFGADYVASYLDSENAKLKSYEAKRRNLSRNDVQGNLDLRNNANHGNECDLERDLDNILRKDAQTTEDGASEHEANADLAGLENSGTALIQTSTSPRGSYSNDDLNTTNSVVVQEESLAVDNGSLEHDSLGGITEGRTKSAENVSIENGAENPAFADISSPEDDNKSSGQSKVSLRNPKIDALGKRLVQHLADVEAANPKNCGCSIQDFVRNTGKGKRAISNRLKVLEEFGVLKELKAHSQGDDVLYVLSGEHDDS